MVWASPPPPPQEDSSKAWKENNESDRNKRNGKGANNIAAVERCFSLVLAGGEGRNNLNHVVRFISKEWLYIIPLYYFQFSDLA